MLDTILVADFTVRDAIFLGGIGIGILILFTILKKIFRTDNINPHMQTVNCKNCGWQGPVSRHAGRCPGCNRPLGDRTINRQSSKEGHIVSQ